MLIMHNDGFQYDIFFYLFLYISCLHSYFSFIPISLQLKLIFSLQAASPVFIYVFVCDPLSKRRVIHISMGEKLFPRAWAPLSGYTT